MPRAPFQVLVLPYMFTDDGIRFALFKRNESTGGYWQGIAGGGEDGETPIEAAMREAFEEGAISSPTFILLESVAMISVDDICGAIWGDDVVEIPEYAFGVEVASDSLQLSEEHIAYEWFDVNAAISIAKFESNKEALRELTGRLQHIQSGANQ